MGSGPEFLEKRFWAMGQGPWPGHVPTTRRWFWVHKPNAALGPESGPKSKNLDRAQLLTAFDLSRRANHFGLFERQNRTKMAELCPFKVGVKVAFWPILGRKLAILTTFLEICTSNLFCSLFSLISRGKPSWKSNGPKLTTLVSKKTQKWPYLKTPFCPSVNPQKAYSSYIVPWICLKLSESM